MALRKISYQGFRNLVDTQLEFANDFNFIIGGNGAGKSNLLEAIFYVGLGSSFRIKEERSLIRSDEQFLRVNAETNRKEAIVYLDNNTKKLTLQGNDVNRLSDFVGWLGITILSIDDLWIIRGSPVKRRSFLNWVIAKFSPTYLSNLIEYRKILRQRNRVLQSAKENGDVNLLEIFDEQLIKFGNKIYKEREINLPELTKVIKTLSADFGLKNLNTHYQSTCTEMRLSHDVLQKMRQKEIAYGHTIVGPHRDDLMFSINGHPLKQFASEGEERATAISLKLAEAEILYHKTGKRPILLLDEAGAEFDQTKKEILLNFLEGQVFYASTQLPRIAHLKEKNYSIFSVKRGIVEVSKKN